MGKIMNFPKDDVYNFQKGLNDYNLGNYYDAYQSFMKTLSGKTLKEKSIKYIVECLIELKEYDQVYKMIENEFVEKNVDEDFLIQKYIFTMYLEGLYSQVLEIIKVYRKSNQCSREIMIFFDELEQVIDIKMQHVTHYEELAFKEWLSSNDFLKQMKIVTNIDNLDLERFKPDIRQFLQDQEADSHIKYILLKYLMDHDDDSVYTYINKRGDEFRIMRSGFTDLYDDSLFLSPLDLVKENIINQYPQGERYLKNIWLTYCLDLYPNLIRDHKVSAAILHCLLFRSMNIEFNINELCKKYEVTVGEVNTQLVL
ncbi:hypothetical protein [Haloplasma contractile]|uniref:Uncharacterized protein n=1 Tax=Haloplasma contractile SSD-17B TaxID=1033810 RepID=U2EF55_9MOLU|nr:hypothetical protein [Haloplasma contractile]ERJ13558.1 hypothetical protein HLPCO_000224 [Haloplasma contractile SSD-17B]